VTAENPKLEIKNSPAKLRDRIFRFPVSSFFRRAAGALLAVAGVAYPMAAYAQGCPLCYNTAAAAKASGIQALRSGILILVIPPLLICAGILWRGIKARDLFNEPEPAVGEPEVERELAEMLAQTAPPAESWKIEEGKAKSAWPAL
jgi:hypothetical protein